MTIKGYWFLWIPVLLFFIHRYKESILEIDPDIVVFIYILYNFVYLCYYTIYYESPGIYHYIKDNNKHYFFILAIGPILHLIYIGIIKINKFLENI